jgi:hypothetical protein
LHGEQGSPHKKNNIYFVFSQKTAFVVQRCYDTDVPPGSVIACNKFKSPPIGPMFALEMYQTLFGSEAASKRYGMISGKYHNLNDRTAMHSLCFDTLNESKESIIQRWKLVPPQPSTSTIQERNAFHFKIKYLSSVCQGEEDPLQPSRENQILRETKQLWEKIYAEYLNLASKLTDQVFFALRVLINDCYCFQFFFSIQKKDRGVLGLRKLVLNYRENDGDERDDDGVDNGGGRRGKKSTHGHGFENDNDKKNKTKKSRRRAHRRQGGGENNEEQDE